MQVVNAWDSLQEPFKAAILALIESAHQPKGVA